MRTQDAPTALLTVSFPVRVGMDEEFRSWMGWMTEGSPLAPGYRGTSMASEPGESGGTLWRVTFRFDSEASRDAWRGTQDRDALTASAPGIFYGVPEELATEDEGESRTSMVITEWVPRSRVAEWRRVQAELNSAAAASPGFKSVDVFEPTGQDTVWTTILTFQTAADLDTWKSSPTRHLLRERARDFTKSDVRVQPAGTGSWFSISSEPSFRTPQWKQAMVVLAVLYPLVTAYNFTIGDWVGKGLSFGGVPIFEGMGLPFPAVIFLGNLVGTALLTWVLMPFATRIMAWWLDPFAVRGTTVRGALLVILVYVIEVGVTVAIFELWGF